MYMSSLGEVDKVINDFSELTVSELLLKVLILTLR